MGNPVDEKQTLNIEQPVKQKTRTKVLTAVALLLVALALCLSISLGVVINRYNQLKLNSTNDEVCLTSGCVSAAGKVLEAMDSSADPCNDFFTFSCGSWIKRNIIPESKSAYSTFDLLNEQIDVQLKDLLEGEETDEGAISLREAKGLYAACLDEGKVEEIGYQPLYELLNELGGWPMITPEWNESEHDIMTLLTDLSRMGYQNIVNMGPGVDVKNSSNFILKFYIINVDLPSANYYLEPRYADKVQAYKRYMTEVATLLNGSSVEQDVADVLEFETFIASVKPTVVDSRNPDLTYNKMTIEEMYTNISSKFDWLGYVNNRFNLINYTFENSSQVIVESPSLYRNLMEKVQNTSLRTIANHVLWKVVNSKTIVLPQEIRDILFRLDNVLYGVEAQQSNWKRCLSYTTSYMGMATGRLFVERHFNEEAKAKALEMISGVREAFDELLHTVPWMNDDTRVVAEEKAAAIYNHIGYPEWIMNNTELDERYRRLLGKIEPSKHFGNSLVLMENSILTSLEKIRKPVKKHVFGIYPSVVNAYYSPTGNQIKFPAGILQPPFWQLDRPESMNYGGIGSVIGHEITHGFDNSGRKYDKDGNLLQWWDSEVIEAFDEAKQCFIDQYGTFLIPEINRTVNGELTQGENIADNGGIKQSYRAYQKWHKTHKAGQQLPGLDYTPNQLFFIAYGQILCGSERPSDLEVAWENGAHTPNKQRMEGTLLNFPEFSEAFSCPAGSKMNPKERCSVW